MKTATRGKSMLVFPTEKNQANPKKSLHILPSQKRDFFSKNDSST